MKLKSVKLAPALIAAGVIVLVCVLRLLRPEFVERPELMTYDMRVREALKFAPPAVTNLGFVSISDDTISEISQGLLGTSFGLYWPRQVYGRLVRELSAQNAAAVGLDVLFSERRPDHAPVIVPISRWPEARDFAAALNGGRAPATYEDQGEKLMPMESDEYFAWQLRRAHNTILAADSGVRPNPLFATNALAVADISANKDKDPDGVLRRVKAFQTYTNWHRAFLQVESDPDFHVDLQKARVEGTNVVLPRSHGLDPIVLPIDADGNFDLADFTDRLPPGWPRKDKPFTQARIWQMGIVLAAQALGLELTNADVNLDQGRITLRGPQGIERSFAVDRDGYFYINWEITYNNPRVIREPMEVLLKRDLARTAGETNDLSNLWQNKLALVGSLALGNDLTDRGATPLEKDTMLVSAHWNVANSILGGRFVRRSSVGLDLLILVAMGIAAALLTWQLRGWLSFCAVIALLVGYAVLSVILYVQHHFWLPMFLPLAGALALNYALLNAWRVVFEEAEQRRVKSIFSTVVSPKIMVELLKAEKLSLGGARREVTVLFADVRGFTEFTDHSQETAAAYIAVRRLSGEAAEAYHDAQARETLATVNLYLGLVAETIIRHDATLDKFIGDCVMAFWGAPVPSPNHAVSCVRAVISAQRAIADLNRQRAEENRKREQENASRIARGEEPLPPLPLLLFGSGINTGMATVGMMGSERKTGIGQGSYTVFGREVNLASRLEGLSGRGRIFISETTYEHLRRDDPALAATCIEQPPAKVKGIGAAVRVYEVPWQPAGTAAPNPTSAPVAEAGKAPAPTRTAPARSQTQA